MLNGADISDWQTIKHNIKVGDKLTAIDPCTMNESGEDALIVGKEYTVSHIKKRSFLIESEIGTGHEFSIKDANEFFKL